MVEYGSRLLDRTFGALADPTRRRILAQLAKGRECVTDLAQPHAMSLTLAAKPMREAQAWIDRYREFWEGNLDQFEKYLDKLQTKENKHDNDQ